MSIPVKTVNQLGRTERDGRVYLDHVKRYVIRHSDLNAGNAYLIPIDAGQKVHEVRTEIVTLFDVATTLTVGDSASATNYIAAADAAFGAAGTIKRSSQCAEANAAGKRYTATDYIIFTFNGDPTAGEMLAEVVFDGYAAPTADVISN
jgi:hypothetical protein